MPISFAPNANPCRRQRRVRHEKIPYAVKSLVASVATLLSLPGNAKQHEALYLLEALKQIIRKNRVKLVENDLLNRLEPHSTKHSGSGDEYRYYWFTSKETPVKIMNSGSLQPSRRASFHGYYIVVDQDFYIIDFGWHKP